MSRTSKDNKYEQLEFEFEEDGSYQGKPYWSAWKSLKKSLSRRRA